MKKIILATGALALAAAAALPASADPTYHYLGGCGLTAVNEQVSEVLTDRWSGIADVVVVATDHATGLPTQVAIDAQCFLRINGVESGPIAHARSLGGNGRGVAHGAGTTAFTATASDLVELCELVDVAGDVHPYTCFEVLIDEGDVRITATHHIEGV